MRGGAVYTNRDDGLLSGTGFWHPPDIEGCVWASEEAVLA